MFMGVGILKVKSLYQLRKMALRYGGVIVFFDEADSLGNRGQIAQASAAGDGRSVVHVAGVHGIAYLSPATRDEVLLGSPSQLPDRRTKADYFIAGMGMGGGGTLQALLSEMSGLEKPRGLLNRVRRLLGMRQPPFKYRILHIFATNMPSALDQAMLSPGIDRQYKVGYPTKEGRRETFRLYLRKVKNELSTRTWTSSRPSPRMRPARASRTS